MRLVPPHRTVGTIMSRIPDGTFSRDIGTRLSSSPLRDTGLQHLTPSSLASLGRFLDSSTPLSHPTRNPPYQPLKHLRFDQEKFTSKDPRVCVHRMESLQKTLPPSGALDFSSTLSSCSLNQYLKIKQFVKEIIESSSLINLKMSFKNFQAF